MLKHHLYVTPESRMSEVFCPHEMKQGNLYLHLLNSYKEKNTESSDLVGSTSTAYLGGRVDEFTFGYFLNWVRVFVFFPSPSTELQFVVQYIVLSSHVT